MAIPFNDATMRLHSSGGNVTEFHISDQDESSDPKYYGYLNNEGGWLIMQANESAGTFRYVIGKGDYATKWASKATLTYKYFNAL